MKKTPSNDDGGNRRPPNDPPEKAFDEGASIIEFMDMASVRRLNPQVKRINVDFPGWMVDALDREAGRLGVTRQSLIKMWLADRLQQAKPKSE
jgi:hypothetical protein